MSDQLLPVFLKLAGRKAVLVGAGRVASAKLPALLAAGAEVSVVAPAISPAIAAAPVAVFRRPFVPADLDGAWVAVAAATPDVNREVAAAAEERRIFVNAVDDPANASAYTGGVLRRGGVTIAVSTEGRAPALAAQGRTHHQAVDRLLADRRPPRTLADGEAARLGSEVEGPGVDERVIEDEVGLAENAGGPPRHQLGVARARPHQPHEARSHH